MKGHLITERKNTESGRNEFEWIALCLADALLSDDGTVFDCFGDMLAEREYAGL